MIRMQDTSLEAWDLWQGKPSAQLDSEILNALGNAGPEGMMCWQIEMEINRTHQAVSGNMTHLMERGAIVKTERKGKTPRGFSAYYWVHALHDPEGGTKDQPQLDLF